MEEDKPSLKRYEKKLDHKKKYNNKFSPLKELISPLRKRLTALSLESQVILYLSGDIRPKTTMFLRQI